ncbi:MAG TPA: DUF11 domain-containing protein [Gemmatimonadales bacterium]|nr:DUF11 domain-containing protein [Gemmatimonadales bacterium]
MALILLGSSAFAQVDVTASAGTPSASYTTLKGAFDAINAGTHQGVIGIALSGDTDEGTATAALNASGSGSASYTSVTISPTGGAPRTVSGATTAGNPLIDLNGADNVVIDGLNAGGNSLTVSNTTVSATSGTSTIRFQGDATANVITNTSILGSSTMSTTTNGGNIWFAAGAVATGNDSNTISNCDIGPAGANLPTKAVYGNGTTTTAALYNSGILLSNNSIFDFFNAAAASNGIYLAGGNSDWSITGNRFYQTATRTQTTGAIHSAIQVANANNNNHLIAGNTIGYASSAGTGTYSFVGVNSSSKFLPICFSSAGTTTPSSIQGNTITAINLSGVVGGTGTTGAFVGISIASGLANIGNVAPNIVGSPSTPSAISITSANGSAMEVYGIYFFPSQPVNVSNNVVAGIAATNTGAGNLVVYGIRAYTISSATNTMQNNTVGSAAAPITNTSSATGSRTIGLYCQSGACIATGNAISNLSMSAPNVGTGSSASVIGLWIDDSSATIGNNVAQNAVSALSNNDPAAAVWVTGLQYNGSTTGTHTVQRNFIHSLSTASSSATATVNGINVQGGATTFQNNMIALGSAMTANSPQINGINEAVAGTDNFYHNSVYVGGSGVAAGTGNSFAFQSSITTNTRNYLDNIFVNARSNSGGTGKHYIVRVGGTAPNPAGLTMNYNAYLGTGVGVVFGLFNGLDVPDMPSWKVVVGQDWSSLYGDPQYLAPTAATPNLHINSAVTTLIEGNGLPIGTVTDDYDGEVRSGLTPTDIGADAGAFLGVDLAPPAITYTPLGNTSLTTNRTLTATLTDLTGVASGPLAPRIYYRKGAGSYFSQACSLTGGTTTSGTWDCVVNNADMGGVAPADVISYFVIAQDTLGNIGSNPGGAAAIDVNTVTTPPGVPSTYTIVAPFTGSYDIGTGQTFTSLTNPGGIFEAINAGALTGNLTLNIVSDLAGETGTHALNQWAEDGVGGYTLTIAPTGAPRTISGTTTGSTGLIRLNGADRVTIDGSLSAGTDRSLTITTGNSSGVVIWISSASASNGAGNNTVKNCIISGSTGVAAVAGILTGGSTFGTSADAPNSNNTIQNNQMFRAQNALYLRGNDTTFDQNWLVSGNSFGSTVAADKHTYRGMLIGNAQDFVVSDNVITGVVSTSTSTATMSGIQVALGINGGSILRNRISDIKHTNTAGYGSNGIYSTSASTAADLDITNNFVYDVASYGDVGVTAVDNGYGIMISTGGGYRIYHNSVLMNTNQTAAGSITAALNIATAAATVGSIDVRDNVFANTQTVGTRYGAYVASTAGAGVFSTINHNDYFAQNVGYLTSARTTLADWQTATGQDASSKAVDPLFVSATDLHLQTTSPMVAAGAPLAAVTTDIDGDPRSATVPDIGADEVVPAPVDVSITKTHAGAPAPGQVVVYTITVNGGPRAAVAAVADTFPAALSCSFTAVGAGGASGYTASGAGNISDATVTLPAGSSVTYTTTCGIAPSAVGTLSNTATVTPSGPDFNPANNSATDAYALVQLADLSVTMIDAPDPVVGLGHLIYIVTAANAGPSYASGVSVTHTLPPGSTLSSVTAVGWSCGTGPGTVTCTWPSLAVGATATFYVDVIVGPAGGTVSSGATVTGTSVDPNAGNNSVSESTTVNGVPHADLSITVGDGGVTVLWGGSLTYTVTVTNAGPDAVTGATVTDTFPAGFTSVSWTCAASPGSSCAASGSGNISDSTVALLSGGTATYSATGIVAYGTADPLTNTATVSSSTYDPVAANNSSTINTPVNVDLIFKDGFQTP